MRPDVASEVELTPVESEALCVAEELLSFYASRDVGGASGLRRKM